MNILEAAGDRFALWLMRRTLPWMSAAAVNRGRANVARKLEAYEQSDGPGVSFGRRFLALFDAEIDRRARRALR